MGKAIGCDLQASPLRERVDHAWWFGAERKEPKQVTVAADSEHVHLREELALALALE